MVIKINEEKRIYRRQKYTIEDIQNQFKVAFLGENDNSLQNVVSLFYRWEALNYRGAAHDNDKLLYGELISQLVLADKNYKQLNKIEKITRSESYIVDSHKNKIIYMVGRKSKIEREEENLAKELCSKEYMFRHIGKIVDYQIPLKDYDEEHRDDSVGKIDLLSVNESTSTVFLIELKRKNSTETMLRCVFEGYTYYKVLNKEKLLRNMREKKLLEREPYEYKIIVSPLVFKNSQPYKDIEEIKYRKNLHELIKKLNENEFEDEKVKVFGGIVPYYLVEENGFYSCNSFSSEL